MHLPHDQLDPATLRRVVEELVTREGTDYGEQAWSLEEEVEQVIGQLRRGEAVLTWDEATETVGMGVRR